MSTQRAPIGQTDRDDDVEGHGINLANDNETIEIDVEGHGVRLSNDNETIEIDVEGHGVRLSNDNETIETDEGAAAS